MKVELQNKKLILNDFFKVEEAFLRFELYNGHMSPPVRRLNFDRGDAVAAIIYHTEEQMFLFTEQFRYPAYTKGQGWMLELVAGAVGHNEDPAEAITREMIEEVGYQPAQLRKISEFFTSPGGSSERIHLFYAQINQAGQVGDGGGLEYENEDIKKLFLSKSELKTLLQEGQVQDAKTIIALQWFLLSESI